MILTKLILMPLWVYLLLMCLFFGVGLAWGKDFWISKTPAGKIPMLPPPPPPPPPVGRHRLRNAAPGEEEDMTCGQLRIHAAYVKQAPHLSARILDWAGGDGDQIRTSTLGSTLAFIVPETIMAGKGPLRLIENGPDILENFVSGQERTWQAGSGDVTSVTEPDLQPTLEHIEFTGDGLTVDILLVDDPDHVTINWGDGTQDQLRKHTYERPGLYLIQVEAPDGWASSESYVYVDRSCAEPPAES